MTFIIGFIIAFAIVTLIKRHNARRAEFERRQTEFLAELHEFINSHSLPRE